MKRAFKVPGNLIISVKERYDLQRQVLDSPLGKEVVRGSLKVVGEVGELSLPEWFGTPQDENLLRRLNSCGKGSFSFSDEGRDLVFGYGSVGSHSDFNSGLTILTFLHSFHPGETKVYPGALHMCSKGEFYTSGSYVTLRHGESLLFDDREEHAWLHNFFWVFAALPVKRLKKPPGSLRG